MSAVIGAIVKAIIEALAQGLPGWTRDTVEESNTPDDLRKRLLERVRNARGVRPSG